MVDLKVDFDLLTESKKALTDIYKAFDGMEKRTSQTDSDWGSNTIKDAMHDFSDNWDKHRHGTMKSIDSVKQAVVASLTHFHQVDGELAHSLTSEMHHSSATG